MNRRVEKIMKEKKSYLPLPNYGWLFGWMWFVAGADLL